MSEYWNKFIFAFVLPVILIAIVILRYFQTANVQMFKLIIVSLLVWASFVFAYFWAAAWMKTNSERIKSVLNNKITLNAIYYINVLLNKAVVTSIILLYFIFMGACSLLISLFPIGVSVLTWIKVSQYITGEIPGMHDFINHSVSLFAAILVWMIMMFIAGKFYTIYNDVVERLKGFDPSDVLSKRLMPIKERIKYPV